LAQTHALAYHVEKYQQDGGDGEGHAPPAQHAQPSQ
jgi:serine/threonine protein kinase